ncbi:hypothetical protein KHA80_20915 [Anaerobacillus sp. HL2]|nr:hypothetical protein KHA80_20915 [Anaerobacillus sp. HL2]
MITLIVGGLLSNFNNHSPHLYFSGGEVMERSMFSHLFMLYGLSIVELLMMVTFAFM